MMTDAQVSRVDAALNTVLWIARRQLLPEDYVKVSNSLDVIAAELRRLERIPALHRPSDGVEGAREFALRQICLGCGADWPCATMKVLESDQA